MLVTCARCNKPVFVSAAALASGQSRVACAACQAQLLVQAGGQVQLAEAVATPSAPPAEAPSLAPPAAPSTGPAVSAQALELPAPSQDFSPLPAPAPPDLGPAPLDLTPLPPPPPTAPPEGLSAWSPATPAAVDSGFAPIAVPLAPPPPPSEEDGGWAATPPPVPAAAAVSASLPASTPTFTPAPPVSPPVTAPMPLDPPAALSSGPAPLEVGPQAADLLGDEADFALLPPPQPAISLPPPGNIVAPSGRTASTPIAPPLPPPARVTGPTTVRLEPVVQERGRVDPPREPERASPEPWQASAPPSRPDGWQNTSGWGTVDVAPAPAPTPWTRPAEIAPAPTQPQASSADGWSSPVPAQGSSAPLVGAATSGWQAPAAAPASTAPSPQTPSADLGSPLAAPAPAPIDFVPWSGPRAVETPTQGTTAPTSESLPWRAPGSTREADEEAPLDRSRGRGRGGLVAVAGSAAILLLGGVLWAAGIIGGGAEDGAEDLAAIDEPAAPSERVVLARDDEAAPAEAAVGGEPVDAPVVDATAEVAFDLEAMPQSKRPRTKRGDTDLGEASPPTPSPAPTVASPQPAPTKAAAPALANDPGKADPRDAAEQHYRLGNQLLKEKKVTLAITELKNCVALDPRFGLAYRSLGVAYYMLGREKSAVEAYESFVRMEPGHRDVAKVQQIIDAYRAKNR